MPRTQATLLTNDKSTIGTENYESTGEFSTISGKVPVKITNSGGKEITGSVELEGSRKDGLEFGRDGKTFVVFDILLQSADGKHSTSISLGDDLRRNDIELPLNDKGEINFKGADQKNLAALTDALGAAYDKRPKGASLFAAPTTPPELSSLKLPAVTGRLQSEDISERSPGLPNTPNVPGNSQRAR